MGKLKDLKNKPIKPITVQESFDFIKNNKDKFIKEHGQEKYDKVIEEYETHLGIRSRKKSARSADL